MFTAAKDAMASKAAQVYLNNLIARYGVVQSLKINSAKGTMEIDCQLTGEPKPVVVEVTKYEIHRENGKCFASVTSATCNRPWLQNFLEDHLRGRKFELPSWAASALA